MMENATTAPILTPQNSTTHPQPPTVTPPTSNPPSPPKLLFPQNNNLPFPFNGSTTLFTTFYNNHTHNDHSSSSPSKTCLDLLGRPIGRGVHYVPGPDSCTLCVCEDGGPKWCKAVLCAPPTHCKSFRVGTSCCDFICLDDALNNNNNNGKTGGPFNRHDEGIINQVIPQVLVVAVTMVLSFSLLVFLVHRLRGVNQMQQRGSSGHRHNNSSSGRRGRRHRGTLCTSTPTDYPDSSPSSSCGNSLDNFRDFCTDARTYPPPYTATSENIWMKPFNSNFQVGGGEAPPPYEEAVMLSGGGGRAPFQQQQDNAVIGGRLKEIPTVVRPTIDSQLASSSGGGGATTLPRHHHSNNDVAAVGNQRHSLQIVSSQWSLGSTSSSSEESSTLSLRAAAAIDNNSAANCHRSSSSSSGGEEEV